MTQGRAAGGDGDAGLSEFPFSRSRGRPERRRSRCRSSRAGRLRRVRSRIKAVSPPAGDAAPAGWSTV